MCVIGPGEEGILLKGGLVKLRNGEIYHLSDCELRPGGKFTLSLGTVRAPKKTYRPVEKVKGKVLIGQDTEITLVGVLERPSVEMISFKEEPPPPPQVETPVAPFAGVGMVLLMVIKKVAGLDRQLKAGSCEIRHQEAIVRIAKLEGKVLRKQIVDGAKTVYGLKDRFSKTDDEEDPGSS